MWVVVAAEEEAEEEAGEGVVVWRWWLAGVGLAPGDDEGLWLWWASWWCWWCWLRLSCWPGSLVVRVLVVLVASLGRVVGETELAEVGEIEGPPLLDESDEEELEALC